MKKRPTIRLTLTIAHMEQRQLVVTIRHHAAYKAVYTVQLLLSEGAAQSSTASLRTTSCVFVLRMSQRTEVSGQFGFRIENYDANNYSGKLCRSVLLNTKSCC